MDQARHYHFVGPEHLKFLRRQEDCLHPERAHEIANWLKCQLPQGRTVGVAHATYIVDVDGQLWIADRRSEHVACADGGPVLAAGEMVFSLAGDDFEVIEASNLSTGFCPEPSCWDVVAKALDRLLLSRPNSFTHAFEFRKCSACQSTNLIKDGIFECDVCGMDLPSEWNFG